MTNEFLAFAAAAAPIAVPSDPATAVLDETMARVGVDGLIAAYTDPAVLALIDQHAAAVRDALAASGRPADADGLASYARSITFAARRSGRPVPAAGAAPRTPAAWLTADWHLLRLVAVCALADEKALF
jgi:Family of unknown function (DUF6401)